LNAASPANTGLGADFQFLFEADSSLRRFPRRAR
jgi:hypothetical protein